MCMFFIQVQSVLGDVAMGYSQVPTGFVAVCTWSPHLVWLWCQCWFLEWGEGYWWDRMWGLTRTTQDRGGVFLSYIFCITNIFKCWWFVLVSSYELRTTLQMKFSNYFSWRRPMNVELNITAMCSKGSVTKNSLNQCWPRSLLPYN